MTRLPLIIGTSLAFLAPLGFGPLTALEGGEARAASLEAVGDTILWIPPPLRDSIRGLQMPDADRILARPYTVAADAGCDH